MRITKVLAKDIYGISGQKEYDLDDKVVGLFGRNGAGKSSFLNTLNFAVSGVKTPGITHEGTMQGAAMFMTDTGLRVDRAVTRKDGGSVSVTNWMNKKKASSPRIQQEIAESWDTKTDNLKVLSSKDLEESLSKDAGKILLSYADDRISREKVSELLEKALTDKDHLKPEDLAPLKLPEEIGWEEARKISASAVASRRQAKADGSSLKAMRDGIRLADVGDNAPSPDQAKEELEKIIAYEAKAAESKKILSEYEKSAKHRGDVLKEIEETKKKLPQGSLPSLESLTAEREELVKKGNEAKQKKAAAEAVKSSLLPIYEKLGTGVCPLWKDIRCSTDMSGAKVDIEKRIAQADKDITEASEALNKMQERYTQLKGLIKSAEDMKTLSDRIATLTRALPPEQKKPEIKEAKDYSARKGYLQAVIDNGTKKEQIVKLDNDIKKKAAEVYLTDFVARAFSDKGVVVQELLSMYLATLTYAASKAEKETGVGVVFSYDGGLKIAYRVNGSPLRAYETLSSGEQALAFLTVSDLLHRIASIPILILDNLDRLDLKNLDRLLTLLDRVKDSYGNIILAGVDHSGVEEVLKKHGIRNMLSRDDDNVKDTDAPVANSMQPDGDTPSPTAEDTDNAFLEDAEDAYQELPDDEYIPDQGTQDSTSDDPESLTDSGEEDQFDWE